MKKTTERPCAVPCSFRKTVRTSAHSNPLTASDLVKSHQVYRGIAVSHRILFPAIQNGFVHNQKVRELRGLSNPTLLNALLLTLYWL